MELPAASPPRGAVVQSGLDGLTLSLAAPATHRARLEQRFALLALALGAAWMTWIVYLGQHDLFGGYPYQVQPLLSTGAVIGATVPILLALGLGMLWVNHRRRTGGRVRLVLGPRSLCIQRGGQRRVIALDTIEAISGEGVLTLQGGERLDLAAGYGAETGRWLAAQLRPAAAGPTSAGAAAVPVALRALRRV